ncbi:MAG: cytochrome c biogenesis protein CcsA [Mucilaginibacter sp.]|uniref:cytochrome c biogenesis protein CcsA n=1 Tax=Mucilaginibacter sp. L3T2-6 TaxID=3062491 RepID=UPI002676D9D1|nr:cytochrome c biogenesis protein CcsA [Mucilaginibacter sp. L3T2-6]MDO3645194.1 cytochrome c biogenesis protein CcsA [Mucilaginibacter sp. L3T2-6]MDV6217606.1 cytochrome c biogenesis protein CcsA [Mucilaginibacter sp. L3T2-6]
MNTILSIASAFYRFLQRQMTKMWWKVLAVIFIIYTLIAGFLMGVPDKFILNETIRNLYFHVPMWMAMLSVFVMSVFYSIKYLGSGQEKDDLAAVECVNTGLLFYTLGLITGMMWAKYTWGAYWSGDPKQNSAAIAFLLYCAYLVLRNSIDEEQKRAKISAIYNIFAFPIMIVLIFVLPRMTDSLHPGSGGNPAFGKYDLDGRMRAVFYPAMLGWSFLAVWIATIRYRIRLIEHKNNSL